MLRLSPRDHSPFAPACLPLLLILLRLLPLSQKHGIQNALTAAVNSAIQAKATNPLEFIGDLLKSKGSSAGGAMQLPPGAQIVQAAACSTMVSHQVPCFVDVGSEAGAKAAAEKDAAAALIQNAAARA